MHIHKYIQIIIILRNIIGQHKIKELTCEFPVAKKRRVTANLSAGVISTLTELQVLYCQQRASKGPTCTNK